MRAFIFLAIMLISVTCCNIGYSQITLKLLTSSKHIELNPQQDHHRIHFHVRFRGKNNKKMFARIETEIENSATSAQTLKEFDVTSPDEVWHCYMRVPKFNDRKCVYTLWIGETRSKEVDMRQPESGFRWSIDRDNNGQAIIDAEQDGQLAVVVRRASYDNVSGRIRIVVEQRILPYSGIKFGVVESSDTSQAEAEIIR